MIRYKVNIPTNADYASSSYFTGSMPVEHITNNGIGADRYTTRARAVKRNDPSGIYSSFNLSNNKNASSKHNLNRGSVIFG